jgi:hypothetical protein
MRKHVTAGAYSIRWRVRRWTFIATQNMKETASSTVAVSVTIAVAFQGRHYMAVPSKT